MPHSGTHALVIGASGGIGAALCRGLEERGWHVTGLSRGHDGLDVTSAASVNTHLGPLPQVFDLVIVATGILAPKDQGPEKSLAQIDPVSMAEVLAVNTIGPALILSHVPRLIPRDRRAVVAVLTARVGSIGDNRMGGWYSYRAAKAAANQIVHSAAIEIARTHPQATVAAVHPGTVATPFTAKYPAHKKVPPEQAAAHLLDVLGKLTPKDTGRFFAWDGAGIPW